MNLTTQPFLSLLGDIEGSRLHHWLARPSRVPVFHGTGVRSLYLVPDVSSATMQPQGVVLRLTHLRYFSCGCILPNPSGRVRQSGSQNAPSTPVVE